MDSKVREVMQECTTASDEERVTFPQVVMRLMAAGVERYDADLQRHEKTYYLPNGESHVVPARPVDAQAARDFSPSAVDAAVRAVQAGKIKYQEFCARILAAGCVAYLVSMPGRRAVYYGRTGECHVEMFLAAN